MKLTKVAVLLAAIGLLAASVQADPVFPGIVTWSGTAIVNINGTPYNKIVLKGLQNVPDVFNAADLNFTALEGVVFQNPVWRPNPVTGIPEWTKVDTAAYAGEATDEGYQGQIVNPYTKTKDTFASYTGAAFSMTGAEELPSGSGYNTAWMALNNVLVTEFYAGASSGVVTVLFTGNILHLDARLASGETGHQTFYPYGINYFVPDPATLSLLVAGGAGLLLRRRRRA